MEMKVLKEIKKYIDKNGYAPTVRELCEITGRTSTQTIHAKIRGLKNKGYIDYLDGKTRTISILKEVDDE